MNLVQHLERLFAYDDWANREVLANLQRATTPSARSLDLLNHVVGAELLWLSRLENRKAPCAVWPKFTLAQGADQIRALPHLWRDYFADSAPDDFATMISYVNTRGEKYDNAVADILTHVVMHSAYHRGQLAADARATGNEPAYTDYIHCMRSRVLEE